jgi:hypothetical protein
VNGPAVDWGPWSAAWFQTEGARDEFICSVSNAQDRGWDAEAMRDDVLGAQARWRPGRFLDLNDVAYAHGGRIVVGRPKGAPANVREPGAMSCSSCKGGRGCATCGGTGKRFAQTRSVRLAHVANCRACEGSGVCQLCKPVNRWR